MNIIKLNIDTSYLELRLCVEPCLLVLRLIENPDLSAISPFSDLVSYFTVL